MVASADLFGGRVVVAVVGELTLSASDMASGAGAGAGAASGMGVSSWPGWLCWLASWSAMVMAAAGVGKSERRPGRQGVDQSGWSSKRWSKVKGEARGGDGGRDAFSSSTWMRKNKASCYEVVCSA